MFKSFITSSNAAVSSACFWLCRAIFSLNLRGLFEDAIFLLFFWMECYATHHARAFWCRHHARSTRTKVASRLSQKFKPGSDESYTFCGGLQHLFWSCPHTKQLWSELPRSVAADHMSSHLLLLWRTWWRKHSAQTFSTWHLKIMI